MRLAQLHLLGGCLEEWYVAIGYAFTRFSDEHHTYFEYTIQRFENDTVIASAWNKTARKYEHREMIIGYLLE